MKYFIHLFFFYFTSHTACRTPKCQFESLRWEGKEYCKKHEVATSCIQDFHNESNVIWEINPDHNRQMTAKRKVQLSMTKIHLISSLKAQILLFRKISNNNLKDIYSCLYKFLKNKII